MKKVITVLLIAALAEVCSAAEIVSLGQLIDSPSKYDGNLVQLSCMLIDDRFESCELIDPSNVANCISFKYSESLIKNPEESGFHALQIRLRGKNLVRRVCVEGRLLHASKQPGVFYLQGPDFFVIEKILSINEPNKALVPTVMSVTPAADAPVAPATTAAHL